MKTVKFEWNGRTYYLCCNGAALCDIYEHFGAEKSVFELLSGGMRESFDAACWLLYKLSEQGELVRRYLGYTPENIPTSETFSALLTPRDVPRVKRAVTAALALGFDREVKGAKPVDLGLLELEKKRRPPDALQTAADHNPAPGPERQGGAAADGWSGGGYDGA